MYKIVFAFLFLVMSAQTTHASLLSLGAMVSIVKEGYGIYQDYMKEELTLEEVKYEILNKINIAEDNILKQMDNLAAIDARICLTTSQSKFKTLENWGTRSEDYAMDMFECVVNIHTTMAAVKDDAVADEMGFALHILGPATLIALDYAGHLVQHDDTIDLLLESETTLHYALLPRCRYWRVCEPGVNLCENFVRCTTYNGDTGFDVRIGRTPSTTRAITKALRNTSAAISTNL